MSQCAFSGNHAAAVAAIVLESFSDFFWASVVELLKITPHSRPTGRKNRLSIFRLFLGSTTFRV